jgi:two-component system cell cycle sensor histidine kinase/response regulator CckA
VARKADKGEPLLPLRSDKGEVDAREAIRAAQRIASQLHQLIAASLTVAGLRNERDIVESLAGSARRVFDADDAVLSLETGAAAPLRGVAQRSRAVAIFGRDDDATLEYPKLRTGASASWIERDWLVVPLVESRSEARGVLAVRRTGAAFQSEDREVLTLLAQMAATALSATELSREIQSNETRLRTLVDTAPAGIVEVDLEGSVLWWNRAAHKIFGWPIYDIELGTTPIFPDSVGPKLRTFWSEIRSQSTPANRDLVDVQVLGRRRDLTASAVLLPSPSGPTSILLLVDDVTDHRQLKAEVQHAQQMEIRGRVASSVAHDFNNLLTLISGYAEILTGELMENSSLEMVKEIQATAARASALTAQLQTIGRAPSLEPVTIDPVAILEGTANVIERIVGDSITTHWSLQRDAGAVHVDPGQFEQMILNLTMNARDAMPDGGELRVTVESAVIDNERAAQLHIEPGSYVKIHVADTGTGMDEETLAKCFDTFFTTKGPFKGTGMGLAAAWRLVEGSRGAISVSSEVGVGTDFDILLPSLGIAIQAPEPRGVDREVRTATVLVAEDDADLRRLMVQVLERNGYRVIVTDSGESALAQSRSFEASIDILVSDVMMGELSGPDLAHTLQNERPLLRVLMTSGTADESVTDHLIEGTSAFLAKPFRPSEFIDRVHELLARERDV